MSLTLLTILGLGAIGAFVYFSHHKKDKTVKWIEYEKYSPSTFDYQILVLINVYRLENGMEELGMNYPVNNIANSHVVWLTAQNIKTKEDFTKYGHYFFQERADQIQLRYSGARVAENVAMGYHTPESYVVAWKNSPSHNANMLGEFTEIGIASNEKFTETIFIKI